MAFICSHSTISLPTNVPRQSGTFCRVNNWRYYFIQYFYQAYTIWYFQIRSNHQFRCRRHQVPQRGHNFSKSRIFRRNLQLPVKLRKSKPNFMTTSSLVRNGSRRSCPMAKRPAKAFRSKVSARRWVRPSLAGARKLGARESVEAANFRSSREEKNSDVRTKFFVQNRSSWKVVAC